MKSIYKNLYETPYLMLFFFFFFNFLFILSQFEYGIFCARSRIRAAAAGLYHSHSNAGSLTHFERPGIEPAFSWMLVGFITTEPQKELRNWTFWIEDLKFGRQHLQPLPPCALESSSISFSGLPEHCPPPPSRKLTTSSSDTYSDGSLFTSTAFL